MKQIVRRAEWIWRRRGLGKLPFAGGPPRHAEESNRFVHFRRTIDVPAGAREATVHISADGRYRLFVNGRPVGRGPARSTPVRQSVDLHDLAPYLRAGRNVVAALVHSYGRHTSWYELPGMEAGRAFGCGGFYLSGDIVTPEATLRLDTGESWRCSTSDAWQRDTAACGLGFVEVYDARRETAGWSEVDFDDAGWEQAEVLRVPGRNFAEDVVPFPVMAERDIPALFEEPGRPCTLVSWGEVADAPEGLDVAERLSREEVHPASTCRLRNPAALAGGAGVAEITTTEGRSLSVLLDFGTVVFGRVRLDLAGPAGAIVDFAYGERLAEGGRVVMNRGIPGFDGVRQAHRYLSKEGAQSWEQFEPAGFRYLQATFRRCAEALRVSSVGVTRTGYPVSERGSFACSDDLLTRMWRVGADTLRLCMHDAYVDCPTREQRQWVGDAYVQMLVGYAAFGDARLTARFLRQTAETQTPGGLTMPAVAADFSALGFMNIPDFCLYWVLGIARYVEYSGDTDFAGELLPEILRAVAWFERHLDRDGLLAEVPHWVFVDWAQLDKRGQVTALNALFVGALRAAAGLARMAGRADDAARWEALAARIADAVNRLLWDDARGVYVDARRGGVPGRRVSQQANALTIAMDVAPRERWARILSAVMDEKRLVMTKAGDADPAVTPLDEERQIVMAQPFSSHFLHRALAKAGAHEALMGNMRRRWGPWIAAGEPTFWELWSLKSLGESTSTCHAWSATPTFDLSTEVLGISPAGPGFRRFRCAPRTSGLSWAKGTFPCPRGDITVSWRREKESFDLTITVPEGAEAEVVLPDAPPEARWRRITTDGRPGPEGATRLGPGDHRIVAEM